MISNSNGRDGGKYRCATFLSIYHNNNNKYIGHRTERPKRALAVHVEVLLIKHNHIKARKRWHRRTDGQADTRPLLYAFYYGRSQLNDKDVLFKY